MTQRQMAKEFNVAHGAIASWESGARTLPGPAVRLLELHEQELGLSEHGPGLPRLKTSATSRSLALSRVAGGLFARAAATALERMLAREGEAGGIRARAQAAVARNLVRTVGELKGLAMKLGQTLAYVDFALPECARAELASLFTTSRPMAPAVATQVVLEETGEPPGALFAEWEPMPFAAASIGQVHRAQLHSGESVAVKVQYPAIVDAIESDLHSLAFIDRLGAGIFRGQSRGEIVAEIRERCLEECDYRVELANMLEFQRIWDGRPGVRLPRVYPDLSTRRMLVMEYIEAEDFDAFERRASQAEKNRAGERICRLALESILRHHIFNADPHPGNFLFVGDAIVFLDFGCVKRFPAAMVGLWRALGRSILERRFDVTRRVWIETGSVPDARHYDFDYCVRMMVQLYEPWLSDEPFRFTREFVERTWRLLAVDNPNRFRSNVPKDWVFTSRLQWGVASVLARIGAEFDFRGIALDLLYEPGEPRPPPYTPEERALMGIAAPGPRARTGVV